jgi:transposase InsO family protein
LGADAAGRGIAPSVGTVGDALDNALMESTIGLYQTELIDHPDWADTWTDPAVVERETAAWVHWYNHTRIHLSIERMPPARYEARWAASHNNTATA